MKSTIIFSIITLLAISMEAQFTGPAGKGQSTTIAQAREARIGTYVTIAGNVTAHQREDYYTFTDATGTIRVQVDAEKWQGRPVSPTTQVRITGEIEWAFSGRYISVETLQVVE